MGVDERPLSAPLTDGSGLPGAAPHALESFEDLNIRPKKQIPPPSLCSLGWGRSGLTAASLVLPFLARMCNACGYHDDGV